MPSRPASIFLSTGGAAHETCANPLRAFAQVSLTWARVEGGPSLRESSARDPTARSRVWCGLPRLRALRPAARRGGLHSAQKVRLVRTRVGVASASSRPSRGAAGAQPACAVPRPGQTPPPRPRPRRRARVPARNSAPPRGPTANSARGIEDQPQFLRGIRQRAQKVRLVRTLFGAAWVLFRPRRAAAGARHAFALPRPGRMQPAPLRPASVARLPGAAACGGVHFSGPRVSPRQRPGAKVHFSGSRVSARRCFARRRRAISLRPGRRRGAAAPARPSHLGIPAAGPARRPRPRRPGASRPRLGNTRGARSCTFAPRDCRWNT